MVSLTQVTFMLAVLPGLWAAGAGRGRKHWHGWGNVEKFFTLLVTS